MGRHMHTGFFPQSCGCVESYQAVIEASEGSPAFKPWIICAPTSFYRDEKARDLGKRPLPSHQAAAITRIAIQISPIPAKCQHPQQMMGLFSPNPKVGSIFDIRPLFCGLARAS